MKAMHYLFRPGGIGSNVLIKEGVASRHRIHVSGSPVSSCNGCDCKLLAFLWSGNDNEHDQL
jgi:hypothetical protein